MSVEIEKLTIRYGETIVVDDLSVAFQSNAISVLLGPSGCGKTTTLRSIAGLEEPSQGSIRIDGEVVFSRDQRINLPPEKRGLGMVFQSYAIWPHMTVFENVALPLGARKLTGGEIRRRVDEAIELVGLAAMRDRSATQLSGGQQQRVAIARCIATRPRLMLLDEPLSNLDAKLRVEMRRELKELQHRIGLTMLFVTHDQEEAMSLADTVYLFQNGTIAQQGAPQDIYRSPRSRYVAEFLGKANVFPVRAGRAGHGRELRTADGQYVVSTGPEPAGDDWHGDYLCIVRPEAWSISGCSAFGLPGRVQALMFLGDRIELVVATPVGQVVVLRPGYESIASGDTLTLRVHVDHLHLLRCIDDASPGSHGIVSPPA